MMSSIFKYSYIYTTKKFHASNSILFSRQVKPFINVFPKNISKHRNKLVQLQLLSF